MEKKLSLFSVLLLLPLVIIAQPVIQSSDFLLPEDLTLEMYQIALDSPGDAGENVTWNFTDGEIIDTMTVFAMPDDNVFEGASFFIRQIIGEMTTDTYILHSIDKFSVVGQKTTTGLSIDYSQQLQKRHNFPIEFGETFESDFSGIINPGTTVIERTGTTTSVVDGFGTLITPAGTFTDVLRIKLIHEISDEFNSNILESTVVDYLFIKKGIPYYVAIINISSTVQGDALVAHYLNIDPNTLAVNNLNPLSIEAFPNPATDKIQIKTPVSIDEIEIVAIDGRIFPAQLVQDNSIDINHLQNGIYLLKVRSGQSENTIKFIKK